jgi:hypothetical protein
MQSMNRPLLKRLTQSARAALALFIATVAVFFSVHAAACSVCTSPGDDHSTARLTRVAQAEYLLVAKSGGKDLLGAASGGSAIVAILPASQEDITRPAPLAKSSSPAISLAGSRNTALAHRAITVLLI